MDLDQIVELVKYQYSMHAQGFLLERLEFHGSRFCRSHWRRWLLQEVRCPLLSLWRIERGSRQPFFGGARNPFGPHGQFSALRDRAVLYSRNYGER